MEEKKKEEPIDIMVEDESQVYDRFVETGEKREDIVKRWENRTMDKKFFDVDKDMSKDASKSSREAVTKENIKDSVMKSELLRLKNKENENIPTVTFDSILTEMSKLHEKKNTDYGDAWHTEYKEFGPVIGVIRLYEKVNRLKSLYKNGKAEVNDESFEDTLLDIANYAVMTLGEMRNSK